MYHVQEFLRISNKNSVGTVSPEDLVYPTASRLVSKGTDTAYTNAILTILEDNNSVCWPFTPASKPAHLPSELQAQSIVIV